MVIREVILFFLISAVIVSLVQMTVRRCHRKWSILAFCGFSGAYIGSSFSVALHLSDPFPINPMAFSMGLFWPIFGCFMFLGVHELFARMVERSA